MPSRIEQQRAYRPDFCFYLAVKTREHPLRALPILRVLFRLDSSLIPAGLSAVVAWLADPPNANPRRASFGLARAAVAARAGVELPPLDEMAA